jgi:hypothetical protein
MADLQVEINELRTVAQDLTAVSADYGEATVLVDSAGVPSVSGVWTWQTAAWTQLQQTISLILTSSQQNLSDTAASLVTAADRYSGTETDNANALTGIHHRMLNNY